MVVMSQSAWGENPPLAPVSRLDDWRHDDDAALMRRLQAEADRTRLMVDVSYGPSAQRWWVAFYKAGEAFGEQVQTDGRTLTAALVAALDRMGEL